MRMAMGFLLGLLLAMPVAAADVETLIKDLQSTDPDRRRNAADELGKLGADAKPAASALIKAMKDSDVFVRRFAAQSLGSIGPGNKGAVEALTLGLRDRDRRVQEAAATGLAGMGGAGVRPLADAAKDKNLSPEVRRTAIESLGKIGSPAKSAVPALVEVLSESGNRRNQDSEIKTVRLEAVVALGKMGPDAKDAVKKLEEIAAMRDRDRQFMTAVNQSLRKIKGSRK